MDSGPAKTEMTRANKKQANCLADRRADTHGAIKTHTGPHPHGKCERNSL